MKLNNFMKKKKTNENAQQKSVVPLRKKKKNVLSEIAEMWYPTQNK